MRKLLTAAATSALLAFAGTTVLAQEPSASAPASPPASAGPASSPLPGQLLLDTFTRTEIAGWGTPDLGEPWVLNEKATAASSVDGATGRLTIESPQDGTFVDMPVAASDVSITARWMVEDLPVGAPVSLHVWPRVLGTTDQYRVFWLVSPAGGLSAGISLVAGAAQPVQISPPAPLGITYAAGEWWNVRIETEGQDPTTVRARFWKDGDGEPTTWALQATDATEALQGAAETVKVGAFLGSGATSYPLVVAFDDLTVTELSPRP